MNNHGLVVFLLAVVAVLVGIWVRQGGNNMLGNMFNDNSVSEHLGVMLHNLRMARDKVTPRSKSARVAIGYNVCLDAVVDVFELFKNADIKAPSGMADHDSFKSLSELAETFLLHFSKAAGGERSVTDSNTFQVIEEALYRTPHRMVLGGNAAIMAHVMTNDFKFENVWLGGQAGSGVTKLLPSDIETVGLPTGTVTLGGEQVGIRQDEVHIIMEYVKGATWKGQDGASHVADRANRFIISHDMSNAVLAPMEALNSHVSRSSDPFDLLVASGFHMLDARSEPFREARIAEAVKSLSSIPKETRLHLELASIGDDNLLAAIAGALLPRVDSIGLNEQELGALFLALEMDKRFPDVDHSAVMRTNPSIDHACAIISHIMKAFPSTSSGGDTERGIQRVHFHSFSYHVIVQTVNASTRWPNAAAAAAAGAVKASERACNRTGAALRPEHISLHMDLVFDVDGGQRRLVASAREPVVRWLSPDSTLEFVLVPVLACKHAVQTVGLGDSISSSALVYQV